MFGFKRKHQTEVSPSKDKTSLGMILLGLASVTPHQLRAALVRQGSEQDKRLGEILVLMGFATPEQVERALLKQKLARGLPVNYAEENQKMLGQIEASTKALAEPLDKFRETAERATVHLQTVKK